MFARPRKFLGKIIGVVLYLIGWCLAIVVIAQAIVLALAFGNPILPILLGVVGVFIWLIAKALKQVLEGRRARH